MNTRRIKQTHFTFADARTRLSQQINALNGEDLAEALAEVDGANKGTFNPSTGQVTIEKEVFIPHFRITTTHGTVRFIVINEEGKEWFLDLPQNNPSFISGMSPELVAKKILNHIGVDITE